MSILNDKQIWDLADNEEMITPREEKLVTKDLNGNGIVSYGLSSFGYDIRCASEFLIATGRSNVDSIDPKKIDSRVFEEGELLKTLDSMWVMVPPRGFVLARSLEYIRMPENVFAQVLGKSTYARCGLHCLVTPLEPGWEGHITLEFANLTSYPVRLYAYEGCAQLVFSRGEKPFKSYRARQGKYQGQTGITLPKV